MRFLLTLCLVVFHYVLVCSSSSRLKDQNTVPHQGLLLTSSLYLKVISQREKNNRSNERPFSDKQQGNAHPLPRLGLDQLGLARYRARSLFYRATIPVPLHLPSIFREKRPGKTKEKEEGFGFRIQEKPHATTTAPRQPSRGGQARARLAPSTFAPGKYSGSGFSGFEEKGGGEIRKISFSVFFLTLWFLIFFQAVIYDRLC